MAAREAEEESNHIFKKEDLKAVIRNQEGFFTVRGLYVIFYYEIPYIDVQQFGACENDTNLSHEFRWVVEGEDINYNPRLGDINLLVKNVHRYIEFRK